MQSRATKEKQSGWALEKPKKERRMGKRERGQRERERRKREQEVIIEDRYNKHLAFLKNSKILS